MANNMTAADWKELARLSQKARYDESTSEKSADVLVGVALYASRMAG